MANYNNQRICAELARYRDTRCKVGSPVHRAITKRIGALRRIGDNGTPTDIDTAIVTAMQPGYPGNTAQSVNASNNFDPNYDYLGTGFQYDSSLSTTEEQQGAQYVQYELMQYQNMSLTDQVANAPVMALDAATIGLNLAASSSGALIVNTAVQAAGAAAGAAGAVVSSTLQSFWPWLLGGAVVVVAATNKTVKKKLGF